MSKKILFISLLALIALAACGGASTDPGTSANQVVVYKSPT